MGSRQVRRCQNPISALESGETSFRNPSRTRYSMTQAQAVTPTDAEWLAHRYDETIDGFHFVHLPRDSHADIAFLSDEYLPDTLERAILSRAQIAAALPEPAPLHFIFHSGFCCSTLLTRALNQRGLATGLSEPTVLRDLVGYAQRGAQRDKYAAVLNDALTLLARPFEPGEAVVVKPSCIVNGHARDMLAIRPGSRAIFLYAPVRVFLNSIARKGITGRLWGRELFMGLQDANRMELGFTEKQLFGQTDLQIAGLAWLIQNMRFTQLSKEFGETQIRSLDSETFIAHPAKALERIGQLFGLDLDQKQAEEIAAGPVFKTHSKFGEQFDANSRSDDRASGENAHADEIEKVAVWVETVAKGLDVEMNPKSRIIG
ncbi:hypothetical protein HFP57_11015 [Parasphingopyxis algicola]|uniref:hypothetical protein n=1 Tax=Parasphingopyxis algicola TaxID=2026624 RepID=UPI0015A32146|nr:hypothetical protein [Parasphingopyxis algicola]QLC25497.1 hypothetical protein HFP57_11015 [Parasphingopyxis algicola]